MGSLVRVCVFSGKQDPPQPGCVCEGTRSIGWAVLSVLRCLSDQQHPGSEIWECFEFFGGLFHLRFDQPHGNEPSGVIIVSAAAVTDEAI